MGRKKQAQEPQTVPGVDRVGAIRDRIVELRRVPASELRPNPKNWRTHPEAQRAAMRGVLEEVGYAGALLARDTPDGLVLIDGHLRAEVGPLETVPVLVLDVNEAEADKILATYDPIAAMAEADAGKLEALLREVDTGSEAIGQMLEDLAEDNGLLEAVSTEEGPEAQLSRADELAAEWGTALGQLWKIGDHRLLCGDSTDRACVERVMGGELADCVFTSPPYAVGIEYDSYEDTIDNLRVMLHALAPLWRDVVKLGGYAVLNFSDIVSGRKIVGTEEPCEYPMALEYWPIFREAGWVLWSLRVWCKPVARVAAPWCASSNRSATNFEHIWTWKSPGKPIIGRVSQPMDSQSGWFDSSRLQGVDVGKETHGAGMPVSIAAWMINTHSEKGSSVHEPFSGTGTTLIACEQLHRKCRAIEISPGYVAVALQRCKDAGMTPERQV